MAGETERERQIETIIAALGRGYQYNPTWPHADAATKPGAPNDLRAFFDGRMTGRGIWKWLHYFEIYERYFNRYRGAEVHILEIGIYSGGSLDMWRHYFGPRARIYGVDIEPACRAYDNEQTRIFIGDQADRSFWRDFRAAVPRLDIVIDDGGHQPEQQAVTLEELLPHLQPAGTYLCEDIHGAFNQFTCFAHGLAQKLNEWAPMPPGYGDPRKPPILVAASAFQAAVAAVHFHPFVTVIERNSVPVVEFSCPKHGTEWQPFL